MRNDYYAKKRIADGFKKMAESTSFRKISVDKLAQYLDINRSTFYYHFKDKFSLVEWIFEDEITSAFSEVKPGEWMPNTLHLLRSFHENPGFYQQLIETNDYLNLRKFVFDATYQAAQEYLDHYLNGKSLDQGSQVFLCSYVSHAMTETQLEYLRSGASEEPEVVLNRYIAMNEPALRIAIDKLMELNQSS